MYGVGHGVSPGVWPTNAQPGKIRHTLAELIGQRIFGIACGHADGNDADHLADDPIHKLLLGRDPVVRRGLGVAADESRGSRTASSRSALYRLGRELAMRASSSGIGASARAGAA